jgi:Leucine-rich repeat (LRR) protein
MLYQTAVTDEGLAKLKLAAFIKSLYLRTNNITGKGLAYLKNVPQLEYLELSSTSKETALAGLEQSQGLKGLSLQSMPLSEVGLAALGNLTGLRTLNLYSTKMNDAGLAHLTSLESLEELDFTNTRVTDAAWRGSSRSRISRRCAWGQAAGTPNPISPTRGSFT